MIRRMPLAALAVLALAAGLQGCASQRSSAALDDATAAFQKVRMIPMCCAARRAT